MKAVIEKAEVIGADATDGKWVAVCDTHGTVLNGKTKKWLKDIDTEEFCECCCGNCECSLYFGEKHFSETI